MNRQQERRDIRLKSYDEKVKVYQEIDRKHEAGEPGEPVEVQEHESGFPAVTVDCGDIHILTDILSIEQWWKEKEGK